MCLHMVTLWSDHASLAIQQVERVQSHTVVQCRCRRSIRFANRRLIIRFMEDRRSLQVSSRHELFLESGDMRDHQPRPEPIPVLVVRMKET